MAGENDIQLADAKHIVRFYVDDDELADAAGALLGGVLAAGDAALVIASATHRRAFEARIRTRGIDVEAVRADGRLVMQDAAELLGRFMVNGRPDRDRFRAAMFAIMIDATRGGRTVGAFGEMVTLLWEDGNVAGALELEKLWDELAGDTPLSLLCAYPYDLFASPNRAASFIDVCDAHGDVVGGAPTAD